MCVIMHNMMVEERILRDEKEDGNMHALSSLAEENIQEMRRAEVEDDDQADSHLQNHVVKSLGLRPDEEYLEQCVDSLKERWTDLCNIKDHAKLQESVMNQVAANHIAKKLKKNKSSHPW